MLIQHRDFDAAAGAFLVEGGFERRGRSWSAATKACKANKRQS
jgi:hypothetical protein